MRQLSGVLVMLIIILFAAYSANTYLFNSTEELRKNLIEIKYCIENSGWENAELINNKVNEKWNKANKIIPILKNQGELNNLEISLTRISGLIKQKKREELLLEITVARKLLAEIYEQEKLALKNIF